MALLLTALAAGCSGNRSPILGGNGGSVLVPTGTTTPHVASTYPLTTSPGPTLGVPTNTAVSAEFTEPMNPATLTGASFTLVAAGTVPVAGVVSYASHTAVFSPSAPLTASTTYTATITTVAADMGGNTLQGNQAPWPASSNYVWTFTTGLGTDTVLPSVTLTVPATALPGPTANVPTNTAITAAFSKVMNPKTIGSSSFTVTDPTSAAVAGDVTYAGGLAIFLPSATLAANTTYTATITTVATDMAGNELAGNQAPLPAPSNYVWTFTTGAGEDLIRPLVTLTTPATTTPGPTTLVPTNTIITAAFSKPMNPATINPASFTVTTPAPGVNPIGIVSYAGSSQTAVFTPAAPLVADTTYTATITTAVADLAGNQLGGNQAPLPAASSYVWTFTTAAVVTVPPKVTLTSPANLATQVVLNSSVNATFNEAMNPLTLSTATFKLQAGGTPLGAPLAGTVTYDPVAFVATFTPSSNLAPNTTYTATLAGATDLTGDALVTGPAPNPWTFTTGSSGVAPGAVNLGTAGTYGIMATSAITSTGATIINGDVALDPGTSMTGFPPGVVNGSIHENDTASAKARIDLLAAYTYAKTLPPGTTILGGADLGAKYPGGIPAGTYTSGSTMLVATPLTLDAGGNVNAVWVFQIGSSLTTTASVTLANGAQAKNVFWVPTLDATVGVGTIFYGTIVSGRSVSGVTGATINGRILAGATLAGTIALEGNTVNVPAP